VAKKAYLQFILLYLRFMWGEGFGWKRHMGDGVGWKRQNTVILGGTKIAQTASYDIWTFPSNFYRYHSNCLFSFHR